MSVQSISADGIWSRYRHEAGQLLKLAWPLILAQLSYTGMGFADTIMVGKVGVVALAAVSLGSLLWTGIFLFVMGVLMACSPMISQFCGAGKAQEAIPVVQQGLWLALLLGGLFWLVLQYLSGVLVYLNVVPEVIPLVHIYLKAIAWGTMPTCLFMVLRFLSEGLSFTRPVMLMGFVALLVNVVFNYALIFGNLGFPALGVEGCALASAIGQWVMFLGMLLFMGHDHYRRIPWWRNFGWPSPVMIGRLLLLGLPIGAALFVEESVFSAVGAIMGRMGADVLAANQIAFNVVTIIFMIPLGLMSAITIRVGYAMGEGNPDKARFIGYCGIATAAIFMAVMAAVTSSLAPRIAAIYTDDARVIALAATFLHVAALFQLSDGIQVATAGALRGIKDTTVPFVAAVLAYWAVGIPLGYYLGIHQHIGPKGLWYGLIAGLTMAAILLNLRFFLRMRHSSSG